VELPRTDAASPAADALWVRRIAILRAIAITLVLIVIGLSALPSRGYDAEKLERPNARLLVHRVRVLLGALGVQASPEQVGGGLIAVTDPIVALRNAVVGPFKPAFDFAGLGQRWGLFLQSGRSAYRLEVEGRTRAGEWTLLYRPHQHDLLGLESTLAFRRLRGLYNPGSRGDPRPQFEGFVGFLAAQIFAEHAHIDAIRVRMERLRLGTHDEPNLILDVAHESERTREGAT
jgi:hypothetical protein